jgi:transcriptional regulator with XRE-family HTH domain
MIRTESEYRRTLEKLEQTKTHIATQQQYFFDQGLTPEQSERATHPLLTFKAQLEEEIETYNHLRRGELPTLYSLSNIGQWLIGVRIAKGLSQKELAAKLGVSEQQVSRDERNEYHGITVDRAQSILENMNVQYTLEEERFGLPMPVNTVFQNSAKQKQIEGSIDMPPISVPDRVAVFLRADRKLNPTNASQLAEIFRLAYQAVSTETGDKKPNEEMGNLE